MRRWTGRRPARTQTGRCWPAEAGGPCSRRCGGSPADSAKCSSCYYLELSDAEIARTLAIGESIVRSTAHRGPAVLEFILIGEAGGHAFVVRNGHRQPIL
jgi:hypothetical protein